MAFPLQITLLVFAALFAAGLLWDVRRRSLHTEILQLPGALRFEAQNFSLQIQRRDQTVVARCVRGLLTPVPDGQGPQAKPVEHTFAALGFSVRVQPCMQQQPASAAPTPTGYSDIVLQGADGTQLTIPRVNATVAARFNYFYLQVRVWIDKIEQRAERERVARLRAEEEAHQAQRDAELLARLQAQMQAQAVQPADAPPSLPPRDAIAAAQIAHWRSAAGFEGQHSLHQTDASGQVVWFVDLANDGRITLHADKRTVHATLQGASIVSKGGHLEIGVRDAYWTEDNPELRQFRVLKGLGPDERRAWKERLEILRNSLVAG